MAKMSLSLKQSQNLAMTPQLQQAIKLLTLTHLEMTDLIAQEMVENPLLEEFDNSSSKTEIGQDVDRNNVEATSDSFQAPDIVEGGSTEIDWSKYVESFNSTSTAPNNRENLSKDEMPSYDNMVAKGKSLADHLEEQLRIENFSEDELDFGLQVIHNLNEDGYLDCSLEELLGASKLSRDECLEALRIIQHFDPVGCACQSLEESLLVQAKCLPERSPLTELIIKNHLTLLKNKDYQGIAKLIGVSVEKVKESELIIQSLHPKVGRLVSNDEAQYVVPDIYVKDVGGELVVTLNDDGVPRLKISQLYKSLIKNASASDKLTSSYVQEKLKAAMWLIKSIENRQRTIEKVANAIVKYQPMFFKKGTRFLKPMILKDIANEIGVHESTVSRVTNNKFMHTPIGTFELKYFFTTGIGGKNGGVDISGESLKLKIKDLIDRENKKKPLSDQKIVEILKKDDVVVARRTVTKYREMLNILSSAQRKSAE